MVLASRGMASWRPYVSVSSQVVDPEHWGSIRAGTADIIAGAVDMTTGSVDIMKGTVFTTANTAYTTANKADTTADTEDIMAGTVDISMQATLAKGLGVADNIIPILSWMY